MKKIFSSFIALVCAMTMSAQITADVTLRLESQSGSSSEMYLFAGPYLATHPERGSLFVNASNPEDINIYAIDPVNSNRYSSFGNEVLENIPVGFITSKEALALQSYTIHFDVYTNAEVLKLKDLVTGDEVNITNGGSYPFVVTEMNAPAYVEGQYSAINDRFVINYQAPTPDYGSYQRNVTAGNYGTICLPKAGTIAGGTLFNIGSYENNMIYIDEVGSVEMEAGKPYIFEASADQIIVTYTSDVVVNEADHANGLYGNYDLTDASAIFNVPADQGNYILYDNQYWEVVSARAAKLYNYFAYIKIAQINNNAPAPGRRRVGMAVNAEQTTTGMDELNAAEAPVKTVIDGKMYIIRGEHMFDATGRMVK